MKIKMNASIHTLSIKCFKLEKTPKFNTGNNYIVGKNSILKTDCYLLKRYYKYNTLLFDKYIIENL